MRLLIPLFFLLSATPTFAEFYRCDGVIQDRPCGELAQRSAPLKTGDDTEMTRKRKLIVEFQQTVQEAKKSFSIDFDGTYPQQLCLQKAITVERCQGELTRFEEKLRHKVSLRKELLEEERKQDSKGQEENNRVIIIRDHSSRYWYRKRARDDRTRSKKHPNTHATPVPYKGNPAIGKRKKAIVPIR